MSPLRQGAKREEDHAVGILLPRNTIRQAWIWDVRSGRQFNFGRADGGHPTYKTEAQSEHQFFISIEQIGADLKANYHNAAGAQGKGVGTLAGAGAASMSLESTTPGRPGSYEASFQFVGDTVSWSFKGQDCGGPMEVMGPQKEQRCESSKLEVTSGVPTVGDVFLFVLSRWRRDALAASFVCSARSNPPEKALKEPPRLWLVRS